MSLLKKIGVVAITPLLFMSCYNNGGHKFLGSYSMTENSTDTTFVIFYQVDTDSYIARLTQIRLKDYDFKYNSETKTLISSSNDTISFTGEDKQIRFTNENGPRIFYKLK